MKPSDVDPFLRSTLPFVAAFKRTENEWTACLLLIAMRHKGDEFAPVEPRDVGEALKAEIEGDTHVAYLARNPFLRYDFRALVDHGAARWTGDEMASPIEFTEEGLKTLSAFVEGGA